MKPLSAAALLVSVCGVPCPSAAGAVPEATTTMPSRPSQAFRAAFLTTESLERVLGVDVPNPRVSWKIVPNGALDASEQPRRGTDQVSHRIRVSTLTDFTANDGANAEVWDCGIATTSKTTLVPLTEEGCGGLKLQSDTVYHWTVSATLDDGTVAEGASYFHTGLLSDDDWTGSWITGGDDKTLLRTEFNIPPPVESAPSSRATLFVSGVGYHEVYLNGAKVGDHRLDQGWTDYRKRVWYSTHDVSELVRFGAGNAIGVSLGNAWWSCGPPPGTGQPKCSVNDPSQLLLQLQVDGKPVLVSHAGGGDESGDWTSAPGPITYNSLYNGETYDGRVAEALRGWSNTGFDASTGWTPASAASSVVNDAALSSQLFEPIRHITARPPLGVSSPKPGMQVFDFGQNQAAVVRLKNIHCDRGTNVTLRHAELLMHPPYGPKDGMIYTGNLRSARATDAYICNGDPDGESYVPTFTQHGFRYVEVSGLPYALNDDDLEAIELRSDVRRTSSLAFSLPLLNDIHGLVTWGQKSNLMSVPTDCPQRDERRGWMGDAALVAEEASLNFGMWAFFSRWLLQIVDAQAEDGSVPDYVPSLDQNGHGGDNWQSAFPVVVWTLLEQYGDVGAAYEHHDSLVKYFDYWEGRYDATGVAKFDAKYGDWVPPPPAGKADGHLTGAFGFLHDLKLGVGIFSHSNHPDAAAQAKRCSDLLDTVRGEFHNVFYDAQKGYYGSGLQSEQAMAVAAGAVPDALLQGVLTYLVHDIQVIHTNHLTTGIIGTKFLLEVLSDHGHSDVAVDLALQTTYPSWGYMLRNEDEPATTLWELWNSNTAGPGMNSRNHIMFGSVGGWLYRRLAGIKPAKPGYEEVDITPASVGHANLTHAYARLVTPRGDVVSSWRLEAASTSSAGPADASAVYVHNVAIPPGASATVRVPTDFSPSGGRIAQEKMSGSEQIIITESGAPVWADSAFVPGTDGVQSGANAGNTGSVAVRFRLSSGRYEFRVSVATATAVNVGGGRDSTLREEIPRG